jgi:hypothetical protein
MPGFILLGLAAAASAPPIPAPARTEARTVVEAQLNTPPRYGPAGGLTANEASLVEQRYLQSIGKRIERDRGDSSQGGQSR